MKAVVTLATLFFAGQAAIRTINQKPDSPTQDLRYRQIRTTRFKSSRVCPLGFFDRELNKLDKTFADAQTREQHAKLLTVSALVLPALSWINGGAMAAVASFLPASLGSLSAKQMYHAAQKGKAQVRAEVSKTQTFMDTLDCLQPSGKVSIQGDQS